MKRQSVKILYSIGSGIALLCIDFLSKFIANAGKVFDTGKDGSSEVKKLKEENEELVHQIGQLSVDINWLKKKVL